MSADHSSKAIEIEDVEFLVAEPERAGEVQERRNPASRQPSAARIQIGYLEKLLPDYIGERHIVTVSRDQDGNYRWEERPGPAPA